MVETYGILMMEDKTGVMQKISTPIYPIPSLSFNHIFILRFSPLRFDDEHKTGHEVLSRGWMPVPFVGLHLNSWA